ncbi:MAG: hypothetical protein AB8C95_07765 [Phycisphaeraceae bacterium]
MIHIAILKPGYIHAILEGRKTIESRLTKTMQAPHEKVSEGERLFLKASGGPFMGTAIAGPVKTFKDMQPKDVRQLRKRFNKQIAGDDAYWELKKESRFATLIELKAIEPITVGPKYKIAYMKAWYVLDESLSPVRDWTITPGALRNHYACLPTPETSSLKPGSPVSLELLDGVTVETELARSRMLRWRGWKNVYGSAGARAGDILRFVAVQPGHYTVRVVRR